MPNFYHEYERFFVSVDCVIFGFTGGNLKLLIQKRPYEPGLGEDSLIGGFVGKDESVNSAASRVLTDFTGLENVYMQQLGVWFPELEQLIGVEQDPVYHPEGDVWVHTMEVVDRAAAFRDRVADPYAFMLLALTHDMGKAVTTEFIKGRIHAYEHDRAVLSHGLIERTEKVDKKSSRRGAALFRFSNLKS